MWLKKFLISLLVCVFALSPAMAMADEHDIYEGGKITLPEPPKPVPGEPKVGAAISPMRWGQTAPFSGVLLSALAVATVVAELNSIDEQIELELDRERKVQKAQCEFKIEQVRIILGADKKILSAQLEARKKEIDILNERLEKSENAAPNLALWVGGSFIAGVVVTVLTTIAVSYAAGARE
jgi:hypothetical protein